jgi:hypothetical protein
MFLEDGLRVVVRGLVPEVVSNFEQTWESRQI